MGPPTFYRMNEWDHPLSWIAAGLDARAAVLGWNRVEVLDSAHNRPDKLLGLLGSKWVHCSRGRGIVSHMTVMCCDQKEGDGESVSKPRQLRKI